MPEENPTMSLSDLEMCLAQTVARVNRTKEPAFVAVGDGAGVAIVDLKEYIELERLADLGTLIEANGELERDIAEGALVPWEGVMDAWQRKDEEWAYT